LIMDIAAVPTSILCIIAVEQDLGRQGITKSLQAPDSWQLFAVPMGPVTFIATAPEENWGATPSGSGYAQVFPIGCFDAWNPTRSISP
jgi:hypothetical protein